MNELTTVHSTHSSVPKPPLIVVRPLPVIHEIPVVGIAATQISFSAKEIPPCKNRGADLGLMRVATPQNRSTTSQVSQTQQDSQGDHKAGVVACDALVLGEQLAATTQRAADHIRHDIVLTEAAADR